LVRERPRVQSSLAAPVYLIAITWLGNAGSRVNLDQLGGDELLNGFDLFEHVVERIYVQREEHLKRIAKGINPRKGRSAKKRHMR
jgi:hypothetical protein